MHRTIICLFSILTVIHSTQVYADQSQRLQRGTDPITNDDMEAPLKRYFGLFKAPDWLAKHFSPAESNMYQVFTNLLRYSSSANNYPDFQLLKNGNKIISGCATTACFFQGAVVLNTDDQIISAAVLTKHDLKNETDNATTPKSYNAFIYKNHLDFSFKTDEALRRWLWSKGFGFNYHGDRIYFIDFSYKGKSSIYNPK